MMPPVQTILDHINAGTIFPARLPKGNGIFAKPEALEALITAGVELDTKNCTEVEGAVRVDARSLHTVLGEVGTPVLVRLMGKLERENPKSKGQAKIIIDGQPTEFEYLGTVGRKQGTGTDRGI
jgi:hypothetical protein